MPVYKLEGPDGKVYTIEGPEGATADQLGEFVTSQAGKPAAVQAGAAINSIPRQLGLTARYALEGPAQAAQILTEPIRSMITDPISRMLGGKNGEPLGEVATGAADWLGLPKPQGANERVIGDAARLVAGAGATMGAGSALQAVPGMAKTLGAMLSSAPAQQLSAAAGAGLASGASREAGGAPLLQAGAGVLGGLAGGMVPGAANAIGGMVKRAATPAWTNMQIDAKISQALATRDVDYSAIPDAAKQALRVELRKSLQAGKEIDPDAVRRFADFQATGLTPTRGMVTQDPVQITREMNLSKMAANSADDALHGLPLLQNQNNSQLIRNLNTLGADRGNTLAAGERAASSVLGTQSGLRSAEQAAWDAAKNSPGYKQPISSKVISDINGALGDEGLMPFMNPGISKYMEAFQTGQPFTPQAYRNLQSMLSRESAKGGNEAAAAGLASRLLRDAELAPAGLQGGSSPVTQSMASAIRGADSAANESINAVNAARQATRAAYSYEDSSPLVRSVLSGGVTSDPQRIAQRFVIGGTANEAADLVQQVGPQGVGTIKNAVLAHLKNKAVSGAADETAKFSQSAFNKALRDIGERKLALLFSPEEIQALQTNGRVSALMQSQPVGSAVNNSNSGALVLGRGADLLGNLAGKFPMGKQLIADPLQNINVSLSQRQAKNVLPGLLMQPQSTPMGRGLLGPAIAAGGLLSAPTVP